MIGMTKYNELKQELNPTQNQEYADSDYLVVDSIFDRNLQVKKFKIFWRDSNGAWHSDAFVAANELSALIDIFTTDSIIRWTSDTNPDFAIIHRKDGKVLKIKKNILALNPTICQKLVWQAQNGLIETIVNNKENTLTITGYGSRLKIYASNPDMLTSNLILYQDDNCSVVRSLSSLGVMHGAEYSEVYSQFDSNIPSRLVVKYPNNTVSFVGDKMFIKPLYLDLLDKGIKLIPNTGVKELIRKLALEERRKKDEK